MTGSRYAAEVIERAQRDPRDAAAGDHRGGHRRGAVLRCGRWPTWHASWPTAGLRVIITGLDLDFRGEPFGPMPLLMAEAEMVDKLHAICVVCGAPASRTQRLINGQPANYTTR